MTGYDEYLETCDDRQSGHSTKTIGEPNPLGIHYNPQVEYGELDVRGMRRVDAIEFRALCRKILRDRRRNRYSYLDLASFLSQRGIKLEKKTLREAVEKVIIYTGVDVLIPDTPAQAKYAAERLTKLSVLSWKYI